MSLGSIVVRLSMDTATFDTDAGRAAAIAKKRSDEIHSAFKKAGIAIGAALGTAGVLAVKKFIENTMEAEKVQAQLMARITDTYGAAGRSMEQLNKQADKLQGLTIFDDEAIGKAQAMLLTFTGIQGIQFDRTIESALDLSTAMGTDATDAAKLLGRALSDPEKGMTALSRAGVVFTDAEKQVIKAMADAGDAAGAQDRILDKLQGTMGTAAEAARNTLGGALAGLSNAFDNLLEGDTGSNGVRGTVTAINNLTDVVNDPATREGLDKIAGGMANIAAQTIEGISAIARFQNALATLSGISDKRKAGAPTSAYSDKELQTTISLLSRGKRKALDAGDEVTAARLQREITALIREGTKRIKDELATDGVNRAFDGLLPKVEPPRSPKPTGGSRSGGSRRRAAALPDFRSEDVDALKRMVEMTAQANGEFDRMAATLSGPLAVAELEHAENMKRIAELGGQAEKSSEEITRLKGLEVKRYEEEKAAIEGRLNPASELIASMEKELQLLQLTGDAREREIALRMAGANATQEQIDRIAGLNSEIESAQRVNDFWEHSQRELAQSIGDVATGAKSAKDAAIDFFDSIAEYITRMIAEQWAKQITDMFRGNGSGGGFLAGLLGGGSSSGSWNGSLTGGGSSSLGSGLLAAFGNSWGGMRAEGGQTSAGRAYIVGEREPELFVPSTSGVVLNRKQVAEAMGRHGGGDVHQTFVYQGRMDYRTTNQMARQSGVEARRAMQRSGG